MPARTVIPLLFALLLTACGGGDDPPAPPSNPTPPSACTPNSSAVPPATPTLVTVAGGDRASIDINVAGPAACPQLNAELLGVSDVNATRRFAGANGDVLRRGENKSVLLFGDGLSGTLQVSISGPQDISISNIRNATAQDGTPGVSFDVQVGPAAALGARTVILRNAAGDVTTFTGGLEVLP